ncbi:MAG: hypothetical protein FJ275_12435, partial [Planctomycetes bacterium]|nr:hypothetical protein [Planctomycetota bacterium]
MNAALGSNTLATLALTALSVGFAWHCSAQGAPPAGAELKWTPHRASVPEAEPGPGSSLPETPAPRTVDRPVHTPSAPATVSLPDGVPPAAPARRREATAAVVRRPAPRSDVRPRQAADGMTAALGNVYDPSNPDNVLGFNIMRTPQGPATRPILAPEGGQAIAMRAAADRAATSEARLGGGLAPRYSPSRQAGRPERLAMNVEGIPSVMTQAPLVGGLDDAGLPGRTPTAAGRDGLPDAAEGVRDAAPAADPEIIDPGLELPGGLDAVEGDPTLVDPGLDGGLLMGEYPAEMHVESFYDDPYACEDEEGMLMCEHHGRICTWLRRFGRPYYGWRWYRDFTASAGITAFTNSTDLGIHGNFGTNEYLNWAMPFWNAFGV